jgi:CxxC-x17-CxxC domain-containing protein
MWESGEGRKGEDQMYPAEPKEDQVLVCRDCGKTFIFSLGGQELGPADSLREAPKRCRACRDKSRKEGARMGDGQHPAICWSCQKPVLVPFKPAPGRPVYCRVCYTTQKRQGR